jgi:hypothetical protein
MSRGDYTKAFTSHNLYYTLKTISQEDCYLQEFLDSDALEEFLYALDVYDVIHIASDDRILLTSRGEKLFQYLFFDVEIEKSKDKVYKINL